MDEATAIIHPQDSAVIAVSAKQLAMKRVKEQLWVNGIDTVGMDARAIRTAADLAP